MPHHLHHGCGATPARRGVHGGAAVPAALAGDSGVGLAGIVVYEGKTVDADQLDFSVELPSLGKYTTEDGTVIEVEHRILGIYKVTGQTKPDGKPIYIITGSAKIDTTLVSELHQNDVVDEASK